MNTPINFKIDLIMGTLNRMKEPLKAVQSLKKTRNSTNIHLILIDQNPTQNLRNKIDIENLTYVHSLEKGLSKARNQGIKFSTAEFIGFPDDDCIYLPDTIESLRSTFERFPKADIIIGRGVDFNNRALFGYHQAEEKFLNRFDILRDCVSWTVFCKRKVFASVEGFNENLGVGSSSIFQAGEETDFILRAFDAGFNILGSDKVIVKHPRHSFQLTRKDCKKTLGYSAGFSFVCLRHNFGYIFFISCLIASLTRAFYKLLSLDMKGFVESGLQFIGRSQGFFYIKLLRRNFR